MSYKQNTQFGQSSDIFNLKELNKPEVPAIPKRTRENNKSSYDIIAWTNPVASTSQPAQRKKPIESNTIKSTVFSKDPLPPQKVRHCKGAETTFVLGTDDNSIYSVKKDKSTTYDPNKYFKESTAYERKVQQFYGDEAKANVDKKSSIGTIEKEEKTFDKPQNNCVTAKDRKFQTFYNNNKLGNTSYVKPDPFLNQNSTNTKYDGTQKGVYNHVEYLKSNIFNDPEKENVNNKVFAKPPPKEEEKYEIPQNIKKRNMCKDENDVCFAKLDWKDDRTDKYFKKLPDKIVDQKNAKQRKINDLYGENVQPNLNTKTEENDQQFRKDLEYIVHNEYPKENEAQIKKRIQNLSAMQGKEFVDQTSKFTKIEDRKCQNFEIKNFTNINEVNVPEIEKLMKSKGMHVYGVNTEEFYMNQNQKGRIVFSLRENNDDKNFDQKFNEIKDMLKKEKGLDIAEIKVQRKKL